jgi:BirA family biotin operon repressor/biotin-[acetyl-CoA-carboxylase] ligase
MAEAQSKGRGRGGKGWVSPMGMGLWLSLLIPSRSPDADALLPIRLGLAVTRALDAGPAEQGIAGPSPEIKWPNDILLANRKVGGILCEAAGSAGVVAGLGLNVRQKIEDFPPDLRGAAVSVEEATGRGVDRGALAGRILAEVMAGVPGGGERLSEGELGEWVRRDALRGMPVRSELVGTGVARGITPRGFLVLETGSGRDREVRAGSLIRLSR